ncbi:MAG TPA: phosphoribosyltransferase family protein, partial [Flavisolibacter sp.]|nr:phosphoribosyltransferase family protein [Flavisolibacter sp.]
MYADRVEAAKALVPYLTKYIGASALLLAIPRGGVPIAFVIAEDAGFEVDLILTKKIGHPFHPEYAIGAVSLEDSFVIPHPNVSQEYIQSEKERIRKKLDRMYHKFMGQKKPSNHQNRTLIVVDDGIATGNTLLATVNMLRKHQPREIIIAVPVASSSAIDRLSVEVDEIFCPLVPQHFRAV